MTTALAPYPPSPAQVKYLKDLLAKLAAVSPDSAVAARAIWGTLHQASLQGKLTGGKGGTASRMIDQLWEDIKVAQANLKEASTGYAPTQLEAERWSVIPFGTAGHSYFGVQLPSDDQARYYRVTRSEGRYTMIMFSSDREIKQAHSRLVSVLDAVASDPDSAARLYVTKYTQCRKCNRRLTDQASIDAMEGPVCRMLEG